MSTVEEAVVRTTLEQIGLSANEITVYTTVLSLGARPASVIAKTVGMQRTRVYDVVSALEARGLVETVVRNRVRHFAPTSREQLLVLVQQHREQIASNSKAFESLVPNLFRGLESPQSRLDVRRVKGIRQVREVLESLLVEPDVSIICLGDPERALQLAPVMGRWASEFRAQRLAQNIGLQIAVEGPPDLIIEESLKRETLSSPDIPGAPLMLSLAEQIVMLDLGPACQATVIESVIFAPVFRGLYAAWNGAVKRMC